MVDLLAPFLIGFFGSFHCLGMCGPLVVAYALHLNQSSRPMAPGTLWIWKPSAFHHLAFQIGRLLSYGFLGLAAASLVRFANLRIVSINFRGGITVLGGSLMVLAGIVLLKVVPLPHLLSMPPLGFKESSGRWLSSLFRSRTIFSKMILGVFAGFLPCMLSWSMVLKAVTTQSPLTGLLTMVSFGTGTIPILFLTGLSASVISLRLRMMGERVAALSVMLMGWIMVFKGMKSLI